MIGGLVAAVILLILQGTMLRTADPKASIPLKTASS